jgi:Domain of unknown function (DUF4965)
VRLSTPLRSRSGSDILYTSKSNRMNPVEVLYAAFPMFLYFDPDLGGLLLEPLLRYQAWPDADTPYAARDAGKVYPLGSQYISRICHKERHTRSPQSVKPITKVSSVRQINPSHRTSLCSEDDSPRDCEYAVNDLCSCSNEWKRHPYPNACWCPSRLIWYWGTYVVLVRFLL